MTQLFKTPSLPKIEPPTPLPDEEVAAAAKRRSLATEKKGSGVQSNVLTAGGRETLGG